MFTGLIEDVGRLARIDLRGRGGSLAVETALPLDEVRLGDSIAVNGACLTVTARAGRVFEVDFSRETAARTAFAAATPGSAVHLERAMRLQDRLDGHLVTGHVDGVGEIVASTPQGDSWRVEIRAPSSLARYIVEKGSIAVHGVSLTVNAASEDMFSVTLVPLTQARTFLARMSVGAKVNLEADLLAKYVERLLTRSGRDEEARSLNLEKLLASGFGR